MLKRTILYFLIAFFISLLIYQLFHKSYYEGVYEGVYEGMESTTTTGTTGTYQPYSGTDPLILAQQNAGNIEYLKQQLSALLNLSREVEDISANVITLNDQVGALVKAQADASQQLVGTQPLAVSGTQTY